MSAFINLFYLLVSTLNKVFNGILLYYLIFIFSHTLTCRCVIEDGSFDYPCNNIKPGSKHSRCVRFVRSFAVCQGPGPRQVREQPNNITHYIDGSMIYGSSERELEQLRDGTSK